MQFKKFDDFHNILNSIWCTTLNRKDFRRSTFTCPEYFGSYICKHIIGVATIDKIISIPTEAKLVAMSEKKKRVRPSKAKKALQHQYPQLNIDSNENTSSFDAVKTVDEPIDLLTSRGPKRLCPTKV